MAKATPNPPNVPEALAEAAEVLRIDPKFSVDYLANVLSYKDQSVNDSIIAALRKAGLK